MSASPLSPLPAPTSPTTPGTPLPVVPREDVRPFPAVTELIPVGKIALPGWPAPAFVPVTSFPAQEIPKLGPLPFSSTTPFSNPAPAAVFQAVPPPSPVTSVVPENTPDPIDPPTSAWVPAPPIVPPGPVPSPFVPLKETAPTFPSPKAAEPDFTDDDLREALAPLLKGLGGPPASGDRLEPMLRATIRRALAEYSPASSRPFQPPTSLDRFRWRMQALFSSRIYEDILFEKTHRFQVEEVFLVDAGTLALISYASVNPGRHASTRRVEATIKRIALQARTPEGVLKESFKLPDNRNVFSQPGNFVTILAVFRGLPNEMAVNDLSYALDNIEARFCERFRDHSLPLLKALQPFLEDCLLIQSPAVAA